MNVELREAVDAYGTGLAEVQRLVKDRATAYGAPLVVAATSAYTEAVAQLLELSFSQKDQVDEDALAECIAALDLSSNLTDFSGGAPAYLSFVLHSLYFRGEGQNGIQDGVLLGPLGSEFVAWLHSLLAKAGYSQDDLGAAWQRLLKPVVNVWRGAPIMEKEGARGYAAEHVGTLLDALPVETRDWILDDELAEALEEIGIGFVEMVDFRYEDGDGAEKHIKMTREELQHESNEAIRRSWIGDKPVDSVGSLLRHAVSQAPASLVVSHMAAPRELVDREGAIHGPMQAMLVNHYLRSSDRRLREAAWHAGLSAITEARKAETGSGPVRYDKLIEEWHGTKADIDADDEEVRQSTAGECERILARAPSIVVRSLADLVNFPPGPAMEVLRLVTPDAVADWFGLADKDMKTRASVEGLAREQRIVAEADAMMATVDWALTSPFSDAWIIRERIGRTMKSLGDDGRRRFKAESLERARTTSSASLAANIAALWIEVDELRETISSSGQARDEVAGVVARVLRVVPQRSSASEDGAGPDRDLGLEYDLAGWLYYAWRHWLPDGPDYPYEELAYLAIRGASLLLAIASEPQADAVAGEPRACRTLRQALRQNPHQISGWHLELDELDFRLHPIRGWTYPWASWALLTELAGDETFFSRNIADGSVGDGLVELAQVLTAAERFSITPHTDMGASWLQEGLVDNPARVATDLLRMSRGHVIEYWEEERKEALDRLTVGSTGEDAEQTILETIAQGQLGDAFIVMRMGILLGPIGCAAWMARLKEVLATSAAQQRIMSEPVLHQVLLTALTIAAVVSSRRNELLPDELLHALLPEKGVTEEFRLHYVASVTQALTAGARLDGAGEWLEAMLRGADEDEDDELARNYVDAIIAVERSQETLNQSQAQISAALRRVSGLRLYANMPELRRYRGDVSDD